MHFGGQVLLHGALATIGASGMTEIRFTTTRMISFQSRDAEGMPILKDNNYPFHLDRQGNITLVVDFNYELALGGCLLHTKQNRSECIGLQ